MADMKARNVKKVMSDLGELHHIVNECTKRVYTETALVSLLFVCARGAYIHTIM